ncbi:DUF6708 domain-containing protein [Cobetia amphilecti]|uniref:DUF6708 domain-containing protein n=1 Tax=Cobetia amphilecti TaxID=1055104 RepID=UPI001C0893EE|nr:DUF6708 domain-containing protein [Cobetia amphilecti]MBU3009749.1 hypothetical protein [Cobetia amphilecti]
MYTGWYNSFKVNRPLTDDERRAKLPKKSQAGVIPDTYSSLVSFNSTYMEFVDRRDRLRGMFGTSFVGLLVIAVLIGGAGLIYYLLNMKINNVNPWLFYGAPGAIALLLLAFTWFSWRYQFGKDIFTYTRYPIRFNRKNRMVYIFCGGKEKVKAVSWDDVFWHIGRGYQNKFLIDLRGHIIDSNEVKYTFSVGHYSDDSQPEKILALWEFIVRYMDNSPEEVFEDPLDRCIDYSKSRSLKNCYISAFSSMWLPAIYFRHWIFMIFYPIVYILTIGRWLTLKSCKEPVWPDYINEQCQIAENDDNWLQEPKFHSEFAEIPEINKRNVERRKNQIKL